MVLIIVVHAPVSGTAVMTWFGFLLLRITIFLVGVGRDIGCRAGLTMVLVVRVRRM